MLHGLLCCQYDLRISNENRTQRVNAYFCAWEDTPLFDLAAIREHPLLQDVDYHPSIDSTNRRAMELVLANELELPLLVLTESQTAGRGRGNHRWLASEGALTFSLIVDAGQWNLNAGQWPLISLLTGLAVCQTLAPVLAEYRVRLKWPNDVLINDRKVCGILVESHASHPGRVVIGVGLNVNNSLADTNFRLPAVSLHDLTGSHYSMTDILLEIITNLVAALETMADPASAIRPLWQQFCLLTGRHVRLEQPNEVITGECGGIDDDGALLLLTETGLKRFFSGTVIAYK